MAETSTIEWTDATWNPITGCSVVSPGCTNCYAMKLAGTRLQHHPSRAGLTRDSKAGPVWTGWVRFNEEWLDQPLRWKRPRRICVCAHGDLFHESVPDEWIDLVFGVMALAQQHTFQVLTKRPARMRRWFEETWQGTVAIPEMGIPAGKPTGRRSQVEQALMTLAEERGLMNPSNDAHWTPSGKSKVLDAFRWPLSNVWLGVSVEDQKRADERIPHLLATPAAVRFVSAEPLLGPVDMNHIQAPRHVPEDHVEDWKFDALGTGGNYEFKDDLGFWSGGDGPLRETKLDWIIAGGESGLGARPSAPYWFRDLRDQCRHANIPFFFKQWGESRPADGHMRPISSLWINRSGSVRDNLTTDMISGDAGRSWIKMERVGKQAAGRLLDGVEHNGMPGDA